MGSRQDGFTAPVSTSAIAWPPACHGYQACTIALTLLRHGMETGFPVSSTTIVLGFADATASITASWPHGSERSAMSKPSPSTRIPNAMTTSERFAINTASAEADDEREPLVVGHLRLGRARARR